MAKMLTVTFEITDEDEKLLKTQAEKLVRSVDARVGDLIKKALHPPVPPQDAYGSNRTHL